MTANQNASFHHVNSSDNYYMYTSLSHHGIVVFFLVTSSSSILRTSSDKKKKIKLKSFSHNTRTRFKLRNFSYIRTARYCQVLRAATCRTKKILTFEIFLSKIVRFENVLFVGNSFILVTYSREIYRRRR